MELQIDRSYLAHFFYTDTYRHHVESRAAGANINNLRNSDLADLEIPLPPLPEQRRIAGILDAADALRRRRRAAIETLDTLQGALFSEMFRKELANWPDKTDPLGSLATKIDYGLTASAKPGPDGPKFLRITDIQDGGVDWTKVPHCKAPNKKVLRATLKDGDLVFARTGATTGKSFLVKNPPDGAVFASYLIRVSPSNLLHSGFAQAFFQSTEYWSFIERSSRGAAQGGVNATVLKSLPIPKVDAEKQIQFDSKSIGIDERRTAMTSHLAHLDALFDALQSRAFAGDL